MKLTEVLWRKVKVWKRHRLPGGNIYRGKYRIITPATNLDVATLTRELEIEEKNMFYLRYPYLTHVESKKHKACLDYLKSSMKEVKMEKVAAFSKPVRLSDTLANLRITESWE